MFEQFGRLLSSLNVKTRQEAFVDHAQHVRLYYARRQVGDGAELPSATSILSTNLPHHLSLMARYLKEEDDEMRLASTDASTPATTENMMEMGPCLENLLQTRFLSFLIRLAETDDPPGMHAEVLKIFSLLIRNLSQSASLLPEKSFGMPLLHLLGIPLLGRHSPSQNGHASHSRSGTATPRSSTSTSASNNSLSSSLNSSSSLDPALALEAGGLVNGILRALDRDPALIRVLLECPAPPPGTEKPETGKAGQIALFSTAVPRSFRPFEVALELMGLNGTVGRVGRETVAMAVRLALALGRWREGAGYDDFLTRLYGDYIAYLIHHSQLTSMMCQELAIRYSDIPSSGRIRSPITTSVPYPIAGMSIGTDSLEMVPFTPPPTSKLAPMDRLLEFWAFVDSIASMKVPFLMDQIAELTDAEFLRPLIYRSVSAERPAIALNAISVLTRLLKTTQSPKLKQAIIRGVASDRGAVLRGLVAKLDPSLTCQEPQLVKAAVVCLDAILQTRDDGVMAVLLGSWSVFHEGSGDDESEVEAIFDSFNRQAGIPVSGPDHFTFPTERELDAYFFSITANHLRMPRSLPRLVALGNLPRGEQAGLLADPLRSLLRSAEAHPEDINIGLAMLIETVVLVCGIDGVLEVGRWLELVLVELRGPTPTPPTPTPARPAPRRKPREEMPTRGGSEDEEDDPRHRPQRTLFSWLLGGPSAPTTSSRQAYAAVSTIPSRPHTPELAEPPRAASPMTTSPATNAGLLLPPSKSERARMVLAECALSVAISMVVRFGAAARMVMNVGSTSSAESSPQLGGLGAKRAEDRRLGTLKAKGKHDSGVTVRPGPARAIGVGEWWDWGGELSDEEGGGI
ncbi:hypothetical protein HK101_000165 [Irineochytrium annulatum]|nr:hypothetical protein HK101_000165 [Irineochytrium annulatum]